MEGLGLFWRTRNKATNGPRVILQAPVHGGAPAVDNLCSKEFSNSRNAVTAWRSISAAGREDLPIAQVQNSRQVYEVVLGSEILKVIAEGAVMDSDEDV